MANRIYSLTNFHHQSGHCWTATLPSDLPLGESVESTTKSSLKLFENGKSMGPGSSPHAKIRDVGKGCFSHWANDLYFSSSDNSDPGTNSRQYAILVDDGTDEGYQDDAFQFSSNPDNPVNLKLSSYDDSQISKDATAAIAIAESYVNALPNGRNTLIGKSVLELGPGNSFATALTLKALGAASVAVADRFLAPFHESYHRKLYTAVSEILLHRYPGLDVSGLLSLAKAGYHTDTIRTSDLPLEKLSTEFKNVDITLSNAVFEHLYDHEAAIDALYSIMCSGGLGLHQVDFRDHRNFQKPLEYLFLNDFEFDQLFDSLHGEIGCRIRPIQMEQMFQNAGFKSVRYASNDSVNGEYLQDVVDRLRLSAKNLYGFIPQEALVSISGQFQIQK